MQCANCGHELREGAAFCPACGQRAEPAAQPVQQNQPNPYFNAQPIQPVQPVQPNDAAYPFGDNSGYTVPNGAPAANPVPPQPMMTSGAVPPPIRPAAPAPAPAPAPKKKGKGALIAVVAVLVAAAVGVGGFFAYKALKKDKDKDKEDENITEVVDEKIKDAVDDDEYDDMDLDEKKDVIQDILDGLKADDYIKGFEYDPDSGMFIFEYGDGQKGGIRLMPIEDLFGKFIDPFGEGDGGGNDNSRPDTPSRPDDSSRDEPIRQDDSSEDEPVRQDDSSEAPVPTASGVKTKIIYGLGFPEIESMIYENAQYWAELGMDVEYDSEGTISDFKQLADYDYVSVELHGTWFDDQPMIVLEQEGDENLYNTYEADILSGGIIPVRDASTAAGKWIPLIAPKFFQDNYRNSELDGVTFYIGSCMAYTTPDLVEAIAGAGASTVIANDASVFTMYNVCMENTFVEQMMTQGTTVQQALDYAKSVWGANDFEFGKTMWGETDASLREAKGGEGPATTKIHCGGDRKF